MKVTIEERDHLVKVYAPETDLRLRYIRKVHGMGNRVKNEILKKLETQITSVALLNLPVILVLQ
ncbi:MAG: hypothetical protein ACRDFB_08190 [Rhabdochlamydiaceae bacterium]